MHMVNTNLTFRRLIARLEHASRTREGKAEGELTEPERSTK